MVISSDPVILCLTVKSFYATRKIKDEFNFYLKSNEDFRHMVQWNLDLRKPDLRKNLDLRKIVGTTNFLVHKLFDLRKIF